MIGLERNSLHISTYSKEGIAARMGASTPSSSAWPTAQRVVYAPLRIRRPGTVRKLFWLNGATVGTDTIQAGLYLPDGADGGPGTRLINGSALTSAGANACQYDDITDVPINPGWYWIALLCSGTTATVFRGNLRLGYYSQASQASLPATATPVIAASAYLPVVGLVMRESP